MSGDNYVLRHRQSFRGSQITNMNRNSNSHYRSATDMTRNQHNQHNHHSHHNHRIHRSPGNSPINKNNNKKLSTNSSSTHFNFSSTNNIHNSSNNNNNNRNRNSTEDDYIRNTSSNGSTGGYDSDGYMAMDNGYEYEEKTISSSSSYIGNNNNYGEWIKCKEYETGKTIWYNKETLLVSFDNPILSSINNNDDTILTQSIAREDIDDNLIPKYILKFDQLEWNFKNDYVDVFRSQASAIDHTKLLPHPNDLVFPEFFSNHTIPRKESFVATILPPIDFNITSTSWKMAINVNKTTASDIIEKFVYKINFNKKDNNYSPQQFVLKVIGNEEYILYDHKKLIIDYEAVRRAVRNEDDVTFGLVHRPDLNQIINECMELQKDYIESFHIKYPQKVRNQNFLKYEKNGCGDGKSLIELKLELIHKQQQPQQPQQQQQSENNSNIYNQSPPSPTPNIQESHTPHTSFNKHAAPPPSKKLPQLPQGRKKIMKIATNLQQRDLPPSYNNNTNANYNSYTPTHRMSVSDHRRLHRRANTISNALKLGKHSTSSISPYGSEPSLRDSAWLRNLIKQKNNSGDYSCILLEDHEQQYRFRISGLTNVTKLPKFIYMKDKIKRVIVRHELWMGPLSYTECIYNTPNIARINDNMKFADWFTAKTIKYSHLPREATISLTVYGLSPHPKKKNKIVETPLAFVRLPLIDNRHRLCNGKYVLNVWPIPVFIKTKHGLKSDPYSHGQPFRFRGPTRDKFIGRNNTNKKHNNNVNNKIEESILDHFNKLSHDICQLSIEFTRRDFDVVAPLINMNKSNNKKINKNKNKNKNKELTDDDWKCIHNIITRDLICEITEKEKLLMWRARDQLVSMPSALPIFLKCVDWRQSEYRGETYQYLREWQPPTYLEDALELLGPEFIDTRVREYGVMCIANMHDSDLQRYLLQLVQCLRYELHHNNALIRLLMRRALMNPYQIGHFLFWSLKSEYHNLEIQERFGLYMEEYLLHSTTHSRELLQQTNLISALEYINRKIYISKNKHKKDKQQLLKELHEMIESLNRIMPTIISLPLNPRWRCTHLIVNKCRFFSSAQVPLLLIFKNVDPLANDIHVLFKSGDDLRQDILTLQVFRVMDKVWLDRGLNLRLITYDVVATGNDCGMVEIVLNSKTTNYIHVNQGGGPQKGCRDETTHLKYIQKYNLNKAKLDAARYNYARSAAGYCVATYVLGIGDRHPDNIMLRENGVVFHIDFGHFLGNFKVKKVVANYSWRRERTPFVFLPAMKYIMDLGGKDKDLYNDFEQWFVDAYMALRIRHRLLFNLFTLMIPSTMPELICKNDLIYLRDQLHLSDIQQDKIGKHCKKVIKQCLNDKSRILDNIFHALKHS